MVKTNKIKKTYQHAEYKAGKKNESIKQVMTPIKQ
jgi:hypothetical protein